MTFEELPYSSTWQGLIGRIRETPDDRVVRVIAADYLEENSFDKVATFIRLQCEDEKVGLGTVEYRRYYLPFLGRRGHSVSCRKGGVTLTERDGHGFGGGVRLESPLAFRIEAGFLNSIRCRLALWYQYGYGIVRHPLACITHVEITDREPVRGMFDLNIDVQWVWGIASTSTTGIGLPVYKLLQDYESRSGYFAKAYPTQEAAEKALSKALIEHAWME